MTIRTFKGVQNQELILKADHDAEIAKRDGFIETLKALNELLKDDYDKLAAECGIHSKITLRIISMLSCSGYDPKENSLNPAEALLFDAEAALDTPEFNFAIAEFKAQGADMVLRALVTSDDDDFSDAPAICANVAAQLRAGVRG